MDLVTTSFRVGLMEDPEQIVAVSPNIVSGGGLAASPPDPNHCKLAVSLVDGLGNARAQRVAGDVTLDGTGRAVIGGRPVRFGVDNTPPTIQQTAGPMSWATVTSSTAPPTVFQFGVSDDAGLGPTPVDLVVTRTARADHGHGTDTGDPAGAPRSFCATAVHADGTLTFASMSSTSCATIPSTGAFKIPSHLNGSYRVTAWPRDRAGNSNNGIGGRGVLVDGTAPTIAGVTAPTAFTAWTSPAFGVDATDNLELPSTPAFVSVGYGGALTFLDDMPRSTTSLLDNAYPATFSGLRPASSFVRSIAFPAAGGLPGGRILASAAHVTVTDAAGNVATRSVQIPAGQVFASTLPRKPGDELADLQATTFRVEIASQTASNSVTISRRSNAGVPDVAYLHIRQVGSIQLASSNWNGPLAQLRLMKRVGTAPDGSPTYLARSWAGFLSGLEDDPDAGTRTATMSHTVRASALEETTVTTTATYQVILVGVTTTGDAMVFGPVSVTVVP